MDQDTSEQRPTNLESFFKEFENLKSSDEKLKKCICFMREALAQSGTPYFKGFWEVRKLCLPLFKDAISAPLRSQFWEEYVELTREGRRLKNLLDQDTAFAVEQIDLAIQAIESEVKALAETPEKLLESVPSPAFPREPKSLQGRYNYYQRIQAHLQLLSMFATRIKTLREGLFKTEMRIRQKNKFFQRLSALGDQVYPLRKQLIIEISDSFTKDVQNFTEANFSVQNFSPDRIRRSVFFFREEIKTLQALAKALTLNTQAFTLTREQLSQCWDQLKGMEKELKKEFADQKQKSSENAAKVQEKLREVDEALKNGTLSHDEGLSQIESVHRWMRELELTRVDVRLLKDMLQEVRKPIDQKREEEEQVKRQKEEELTRAKREQVDSMRQKIDSLRLQLDSTQDHEALRKELEVCKRELAELPVTKGERQVLERSLKTVRDQIDEKKEQALLALSDDDRATLEHLQEALEQRRERRKAIKAQIEEYRKIIGGSGLDINKGMHYQKLMSAEKERLEKIEAGIEEIKNKITNFKKTS